MSQNLPAQVTSMQFTTAAVNEWSSQLKALLETKHLYQKVEAAIDLVRQDARGNTSQGHQTLIDQFFSTWEKRRLKPVMAIAFENQLIGGQQVSITSPILLVTNVKLLCRKCESSEVFSPLWARDVAEECVGSHSRAMPRKDSHQLFFIAFQCQRCSNDPEGFIVRRSADRLFLEGRSPIEHVDLPKYLPKKEAHFFSDAIIAFNAGKKLAALFYLRTFLEQFAKRITGTEGRVTGVELMEAYTATLPQAHRDYMPSFREWYEKLSEALHAAREDDTLFENAKSEIDRHFDIRRVYKIPENGFGTNTDKTNDGNMAAAN